MKFEAYGILILLEDSTYFIYTLWVLWFLGYTFAVAKNLEPKLGYLQTHLVYISDDKETSWKLSVNVSLHTCTREVVTKILEFEF